MSASAAVTFVSKCPNQELKMVQSNRTVEHGVVVFKPGRNIRFVNHEYVTSDPEEIEFIRGHRFYGLRISDLDNSQTANPVKSKPTIQRIMSVEDPAAVTLACGYVNEAGETCDYVAEGENEAEAMRRLNGHKTSRGHR